MQAVTTDMTAQQVEQIALRLPIWEQLRIARALLDSVLLQNGNYVEDNDIQLQENGVKKKPRPIFGSGKGLFEMKDNFDDPIEGFEPYMQ